jgi:hypothetical protein
MKRRCLRSILCLAGDETKQPMASGGQVTGPLQVTEFITYHLYKAGRIGGLTPIESLLHRTAASI